MRASSVVAELNRTEYSNENCSACFPLQGRRNSTSSIVVDSESYTSTKTLKYLLEECTESSHPCAIVEPIHNDVGLKLSILASEIDVPIISPAITSPSFNSRRYPLTTKTMVNSHAITEALVDFLRYKSVDWNYVAVMYDTQDYSIDWVQNFESAAEEREDGPMTFRKEKLIPNRKPGEEFSVSYAMNQIKKLTYRTIVVRLFNGWEDESNPRLGATIEDIANVAEEVGMNGEGYVWIFSEGIDIEFLLYHPNPNVTKLTEGSGIINVIDEFQYKLDDDAFLESWKRKGEAQVSMINEAMPIKNGTPGYFQANSTFFQTYDPSWGSGFAYDAVMSVGMGACHALAKNTQNQGRRRAQKGAKNLLLEGILASDFHGASGHVSYGEKGPTGANSRDRFSVVYGIYNIQRSDSKNDQFEAILSDVLLPGIEARWDSSRWISKNGGFVFADGIKNSPTLFRDTPNKNYLKRGVQIFGLLLMSLSMCMCVAASLWVYRSRESSIMKASQPLFLHILCLGALVSSFSIFTLSFDENNGGGKELNAEQLSVMCASFPWLVCLGFLVIYCALFSKLWRINKVLQFSRRKVTIKHVIGPFAALVISAIIVLAVWSTTYPLKWERKEIDLETGESYGKCQNEHSLIFAVALVLVVLLSFCMTGAMAWITKDVDEKYAETQWIFYTIFVQIQVLLVAIPIMIVLEHASADAAYIVKVMIIAILPMSTIGLMIGPKIATSFKKEDKEKTKSRGTQGRTVISGVTSTTYPSTFQARPDSSKYPSSASGQEDI